jgi:thiosulfate dehydrogenase [quinone] large subunit
MQAAASSSPISALVNVTAEHASLFGLTIAFGELAVGLGILLGMWTRLAAVGGLLLSLSFFLTVSWGTSPYFFGPDIVFVFAFTPLVVGGDGGVLSLQAKIRKATRRSMRLPASRPSTEPASVTSDVDRRVLLRTGTTAALIGVGALIVAGMGRVVAGGQVAAAQPLAAQPDGALPAQRAQPAQPNQPNQPGKPHGGKKIGASSDVPVGGVLAFTNPKTNDPSYVLQPKKGTYLAYSAVCTHQGCTVGYDQGSGQFACPCHGARFDASTGDAVRGPARKPLAKITVVESNGNLYVV